MIRYPKETRERAVAMYIDGATMWDIEVSTGAADTTIRRWVRRAGHQLRDPHGRTKTDVAAIRDAYHKPGQTITGVARELGIPFGTAYYHIAGRRR